MAPGKEGFPTVAYNCSVYHDGSFAYVSAGTYGSANDKTLVKFDNFVHALRTAPFYLETAYTLKVL